MKTTCLPRGPRTATSRAALLALAAVCLPPAHAATRSWICGQGLFEEASCWLPIGVPGAADDAFVTTDQGVVVFSAQSGTRSLRDLKIDPRPSSSSSTFAAFVQNGGSLTTSSIQVGPIGGAEFLQYGGTLTTSTLRIQGSERASRYELGGGTLGVTTNVVLGGGSAASPSDYLNMSSFSHEGGRATIQDLRVGSGGTGVYFMPDVQFQTAELIAPLMTVGVDAQGTFFQSGFNTSVTANTLVVGGIGSGRYEMSAGVLATTSVDVGTAGHGVFEHSGGTHRLDDAMTVGTTGRYSLSGTGVLQMGANTSVVNLGSFEHTGGSFTGTLDNQGSFFFANAPLFNGRLINRGSVVMDGSGAFGNGLRNEAGFDTLPTGLSLALNGDGLDNQGSLVLRGGTLHGSGVLANNASFSGFGAIAGSGGFFNRGTLAQGAGALVLNNTGGHSNQGLWSLGAQSDLQISGASRSLNNQGQLLLAGGKVSGAGSLNNGMGGTVSGRGRIDSRFANGGTLALGAGEQLTVSLGFVNTGLVDMGAGSALLAGGALVNNGLVAGRGRVANAVSNEAQGRIQADGGVLVLGGSVSNSGLMEAQAGGTLLLQGALAAQTGTLQLSGGTIDTASNELHNEGVIRGFGTLRSTLIANAGQMQFSGGSAQVHGSVDHLAGAAIIVSGGGVGSFYGNVQAQAGSEIRVSAGSAAVFFGNVSQASGAAFNGTGSFHFEGGLSVGQSPGLGGAQGDVLFGSGNLYRAEIGGLAGGTGYDRFVVGGALGFGGALQLSLLDGFEPAAGQRFDLFDWAQRSGQFASIDFSAAALADGLRWDTSRLYSDGSVGVTAVPEPGAWALMAGGLLALHLRLRRAAVARPCRPLA
jgi:hypothetical protein